MAEDFLDERTRAEDILLGSVGYGEDAQIVVLERTSSGYCGRGKFQDGEEFDFESDGELDSLEIWALEVLLSRADS